MKKEILMGPNFAIGFCPEPGYCCIVYSVKPIHPIEVASELAGRLQGLRMKGWVLIDGLVVTGNERNRFAQTYFDGRIIARSSTGTAKPVSREIFDTCSDFYKNHFSSIDSSAMPTSTKFLVRHGRLNYMSH